MSIRFNAGINGNSLISNISQSQFSNSNRIIASPAIDQVLFSGNTAPQWDLSKPYATLIEQYINSLYRETEDKRAQLRDQSLTAAGHHFHREAQQIELGKANENKRELEEQSDKAVEAIFKVLGGLKKLSELSEFADFEPELFIAHRLLHFGFNLGLGHLFEKGGEHVTKKALAKVLTYFADKNIDQIKAIMENDEQRKQAIQAIKQSLALELEAQEHLRSEFIQLLSQNLALGSGNYGLSSTYAQDFTRQFISQLLENRIDNHSITSVHLYNARIQGKNPSAFIKALSDKVYGANSYLQIDLHQTNSPEALHQALKVIPSNNVRLIFIRNLDSLLQMQDTVTAFHIKREIEEYLSQLANVTVVWETSQKSLHHLFGRDIELSIPHQFVNALSLVNLDFSK